MVISASHNPYQDNGIKVFSGSGEKYGEHLEERIEQLVADSSWDVPSGGAPEVSRADHLRVYLDHVFFVRGKEASFPFYPVEVPVDAGIVGIVDHWHIG